MTIKFTQVAIGQYELFALDQYGRIWRYNFNDVSWSLILSPVENRGE